MKTKNDLTSRQWKLYDYLKEQDDYKNIKEILVESGLYENTSSGARMLRKDIRALRASSVVQYTILSSGQGYKIATKEEYMIYRERKYRALNRAFKLQVLQDRKAGLDNQTRFVFNQEKDTIEAFREASV